MLRVEPGTGVPSGVRTMPAKRNPADGVVSGVSCAASEVPQTAINQSSAASLLPSTSHAHCSPELLPFSRFGSSNNSRRNGAAILLFTCGLVS